MVSLCSKSWRNGELNRIKGDLLQTAGGRQPRFTLTYRRGGGHDGLLGPPRGHSDVPLTLLPSGPSKSRHSTDTPSWAAAVCGRNWRLDVKESHVSLVNSRSFGIFRTTHLTAKRESSKRFCFDFRNRERLAKGRIFKEQRSSTEH